MTEIIAPHAGGLQLALELERPEFDMGQAVRLNVSLLNAGRQSIDIGGSAFEMSAFRFEMRDAQGRQVPLLAYGRGVLSPPLAVFANALLTLGAGQARRCQFDLGRMFDLSLSGDYTLLVRRVVQRHTKTGSGSYRTDEAIVRAAPLAIRILEASSPVPAQSQPALSSRQFLLALNSSNAADKRGRAGHVASPQVLAAPSCYSWLGIRGEL